MKKFSSILTTLVLAGCAATTQSKPATQPVHQPVKTTAYVTIHSQPEGAMIFVMKGFDGWQSLGYAPVQLPVTLADGKLYDTWYFQAIPTAPGQFTQRGSIGGYFGNNQCPG